MSGQLWQMGGSGGLCLWAAVPGAGDASVEEGNPLQVHIPV